MKTKVNEYLMTLDDEERAHLLKPENKWQLLDRVWNEAIRQAADYAKTNYDHHEPWGGAEDIKDLAT